MQRARELLLRHATEFKILLFFVFISMAIVGIIQNLPKTPASNQLTYKEKIIREDLLLKFESNLLTTAREKVSRGERYSPYDYFDDLVASYRKSEELFGKRIYLNFSPMSELPRLVQKDVHADNSSGSEIELARNRHWEYLNSCPERSSTPINWSYVLVSLFSKYLKYFPLAFLLLLIWELESHEKRSQSDQKRLSFVLKTVFYPLILGFYIARWIKRGGREVYAEAELRRSSRLFSRLTPQDVARIKEFVKSKLPLVQWRRQLSNLNFRPKYSLATAMAVTLLFVIVIRPAEAGAKEIKSFCWQSIPLCQLEVTKNLARASVANKTIQHENGQENGCDAGTMDIIFSTLFFHSPVINYFLLTLQFIFPLSSAYRKIDHIPIRLLYLG